LDNVRLATLSAGPSLTGPIQTNGQFQFTVLGDPGSQWAILATTNLSLATTNWTRIGNLTNLTGSQIFVDHETNGPTRFYRAQQLP
jgi:hypothetical protein